MRSPTRSFVGMCALLRKRGLDRALSDGLDLDRVVALGPFEVAHQLALQRQKKLAPPSVRQPVSGRERLRQRPA